MKNENMDVPNDQASKLREDANLYSEALLPPRSETHKHRKKHSHYRVQYPLLRLLLILFLLLIVIVFTYDRWSKHIHLFEMLP